MIMKIIKESVLEVGYAIYMPEVYKILMVRIFLKTEKMTKFRMYKSITGVSRKAIITLM